MSNIEKLDKYSMNYKHIPDGYDMDTQVTATDDNMKMLVDKVNELVDLVNSLTQHDKQSGPSTEYYEQSEVTT